MSIKIKVRKVTIILAEHGKNFDDDTAYLPEVKTIQGLLFETDGAHSDEKGYPLLSEKIIPSLEKQLEEKIQCKCKLNPESSCKYIVAENNQVFEVGMFGPHRRWLRELSTDGEHIDQHYLIGAIFSS